VIPADPTTSGQVMRFLVNTALLGTSPTDEIRALAGTLTNSKTAATPPESLVLSPVEGVNTYPVRHEVKSRVVNREDFDPLTGALSDVVRPAEATEAGWKDRVCHKRSANSGRSLPVVTSGPPPGGPFSLGEAEPLFVSMRPRIPHPTNHGATQT
jgi:hypothetical protein